MTVDVDMSVDVRCEMWMLDVDVRYECVCVDVRCGMCVWMLDASVDVRCEI